MSKIKSKRIHLTRHAQAEHNVAFDYTSELESRLLHRCVGPVA